MAGLNEILARRNPELWLITAMTSSREVTDQAAEQGPSPLRNGLIATTVTSVSIVPHMPRVLIVMAKRHFTWQMIESTGRFTLHMLGDANLDLVWRFGTQSGRDVDKFAGLATEDVPAEAGDPEFLVVPPCLSWLGCRVEEQVDIGDRTVYVAEVVNGALLNDEQSPLTMQHLVEVGPPEKLAILREQSELHATSDVHAIRSWREQKQA